MKNLTINSKAVEYLKKLVGEKAKIVDLYVKGKWLIAEIQNTGIATESGRFAVSAPVNFMVTNNPKY